MSSGKYFINNVDIFDIINAPTNSTRTEFVNFPGGTTSGNRSISNCLNFGYRINNVDMGPSYRAIQYNSGPIDLTTAYARKFKHFSALIYGGGGGGGGGGGLGWNGTTTGASYQRVNGESGGYGGWGGYGQVNDYPISTSYNSIAYYIGGGGTGGAYGGNSSTTPITQSRSGGNGVNGIVGGASDLYLENATTNTLIVTANGGGGGVGGAGGRRVSQRADGAHGNGTGGGPGYDITSANTAYYDHDNYGGAGGKGGGLEADPAFPQSYGLNGNVGVGWVWLKYLIE